MLPRTCLAVLWLIPCVALAAGPSTKPTLIRISGKELPAKALFAELSRQSGVAFAGSSPELLASGAPVTVEIEEQGFWPALAVLSGKTGLYPQLVDRDKLTLTKGGKGWFDGPVAYSGPCLIVAIQTFRASTVRYRAPDQTVTEMTIQLAVVPEPRLRFLRGSKYPHFDEVVDEKGNSLLPAGQMSDAPVGGGPYAWSLEGKLKFNAEAGKKIARLRGSARYVMQVSADTVEQDQILAVNSVMKKAGDRAVTIVSCVKGGENGKGVEEYTLKTSMAAAAGREDLMHPAGVMLIDEKGVGLVLKSWLRGPGVGRVDYRFNFLRVGEGDKAAPGVPKKLVWEIPAEVQEITIPFEIRDLVIP